MWLTSSEYRVCSCETWTLLKLTSGAIELNVIKTMNQVNSSSFGGWPFVKEEPWFNGTFIIRNYIQFVKKKKNKVNYNNKIQSLNPCWIGKLLRKQLWGTLKSLIIKGNLILVPHIYRQKMESQCCPLFLLLMPSVWKPQAPDSILKGAWAASGKTLEKRHHGC